MCHNYVVVSVSEMKMSRDKDEYIDKYLKYVAGSRGEPDDFDSWAEDNRLHIKKKKRTDRLDDDDNS